VDLEGRWLAAVLACGDRAVLSRRSAAALWGLRPSDAIEVTVLGRSRHRRRGIVVHSSRDLPAGDRTTRRAIPVTTVPRTLVDLAGVVNKRDLERTLEEAERLRLLDLAALRRILERGSRRQGTPLVREILGDALPGAAATRSELERRFLVLCRRAGLPLPAVNVTVAGFEVDAAWPEARLVVELDGHAYHRTRAAFERDRARDTALQLAGFRVLRVTHRRLEQEPAAVLNAVRSLLDLPTAQGEPQVRHPP
jgi:REase_MTES_1575